MMSLEFQNTNEEVKSMIDQKVSIIVETLLMTIVFPWAKLQNPTRFDEGFAHGQTDSTMRRFYECWPELFGEEAEFTPKFDTTTKQPPAIVVDFGRKNVGLAGEYEKITIGGEGLVDQVEALMQRQLRRNDEGRDRPF